jgi:hypothetical protein
MSPVEFSGSTTGVDWAALKAALAADSFDNGRTPHEYRISHEQSDAIVFRDGMSRVVGPG